jgi:hypothetical protein
MVSGGIQKHDFDPGLRDAVAWQVKGLVPARQGAESAVTAPATRATRKPRASS